MRSGIPIPRLIIAGLLGLVIGAGCGGQEGTSDGSGEQAPGTVEIIETDPAASVPGTRKIPTEVDEIIALFPDDLPTWDEATLTEAIAGGAGEGVQTLDADVSAVEAASFYRDALEAKGWDLQGEKTVEDFTLLEFTRGGEVLTVTLSPNDSGGTQIDLINR